MFIYYYIVKIVFKINNWSQTTDSKTDLSVIQTDITTLDNLLNNESVDEFIRLTKRKVQEIYEIIRKNGKNNLKENKENQKDNMNRKIKTNEVSTSTSKRRRKT